MLRLVNPNDFNVDVEISGLDDAGRPSLDTYDAFVRAGAAVTVTAQDLEEERSPFGSVFGDGEGKWQLSVYADGPLWVMSLLQTPTGHLTNLSTEAPRLIASEPLPSGIPPRPTGFTATTGIGVVLLFWENPHSRYDNHKSTWVYRSRSPNFSSVTRIGVSRGISYVDRNVEGGTSYYYWIQWESTEGVLGQPASPSPD